jgi:hypothetical protein
METQVAQCFQGMSQPLICQPDRALNLIDSIPEDLRRLDLTKKTLGMNDQSDTSKPNQ